MSIPSSSGSGGGVPKGISLTNTVHCEVATCLPLPCLPVLCGALDEDLRLFEQQSGSRTFANSSDVAGKIADLLRITDVSYLFYL
ncbi:sister chromatid cohesion protein SCC2-like isoform X2 [Olea europaea var. sylvestris]|uniref:sister chromatid cohesion protein SCC2-like isoform X2 n=1 Tax=Olea europaea var. sylvestris TaxID=158386 RepID=UPI000C1D23F9|nr:sister chromatid cohesion protein SCC2-like isoform X2 [Olea europaea var. sylvestris]